MAAEVYWGSRKTVVPGAVAHTIKDGILKLHGSRCDDRAVFNKGTWSYVIFVAERGTDGRFTRRR